MPDPLRTIVDRLMAPDESGLRFPLDVLECGHTVPRPLGLGEAAFEPSKAKRRRCWKCGEAA